MKATISPIALATARMLASQNIYLAPKKGGFFEVLADELIEADKPEAEDSLESYVAKVNTLFENARPGLLDQGFEDLDPNAPAEIGIAYDEVTKQAINDLTPLVNNITHSVNNVVLPAVCAIFENAMQRTDNSLSTCDINLNIVTNNAEKSLWSNPSFLGLLSVKSDLTESKKDHLDGNIVFPDLSTDVLLSYMETGNELLDAELNEFLNGVDKETLLRHTFNEIFAYRNVESGSAQGKHHEWLAAFFIGHGLLNHVPDGVSGVDLSEYEICIQRVINYYSAMLLGLIDSFRETDEMDRLVISYPKANQEFVASGATIIVNGRLIKHFYDNGGTVEALYGAYISPNRLYSETDILSNQSILERRWENHMAYHRSRYEDNFQRVYVGALKEAIYKYANENNLKVKANDFEPIYQDEFHLCRESAHHITTETVIKTLFDNNREYRMITGLLGRLCVKHPDIDKETAMELALIEWLANWALAHVEVTVGE